MRKNINPELAHKMQRLYLDLLNFKQCEETEDSDLRKFRNQISEEYKAILDLTPNLQDSSIIHECQYCSEESGYPNTWFIRYSVLGGDSIRIVDSSYGG